MQRLFGTDGIRAKAGEFPLDATTVSVIGTSLAKQFKEKLGHFPRFVTGRDTRESGVWIENAIQAGVRSAGAYVESAGVVTTPGVAFITRKFGFDAGIVISASHNPFDDNGIKVFLPNGQKLGEEMERKVEEDIASEAFIIGSEITDVANSNEGYHDAYLQHLANEIPGLDLSDFSIVVDCANGAASNFAGELLTRLGAKAELVNDEPNGRNINFECGSLHLEGLQEHVVSSGADLGVAYDGDADRALFVDEKGNIVDGDATLWILGRRMKDESRLVDSTVVSTVMSNLGLEIAFKSYGVKLVRTSVGDKYVLDELLRSGASIGGEQSGHIIFPYESLVGDGMLTTLFLLDALIVNRKSLSESVEGFVRYPQVLVNVRVREKRPFESVPVVADAAKEVEQKLGGTGRLLLRYSGTENLARVMIEGKNQTEIENLAKGLGEIIERSLG